MGGHLGAGEVHLDHVGAGLGDQAGKLLPVLLGGAHNGGDKDLVGIGGLQLAEILQVLLQGMLSDLLHILEADKGGALLGQGVEPGRDLVDEEVARANGLEDDAGPALVIGLGAHLVAIAYRRGGEAERVFKMYPEKLNG